MIHIGDLAARSGVSTRALRYYEAQGLLPAAARTSGGQRLYAESAPQRVELIRYLFGAGLPSRNVAKVLPMVDNHESDDESVAMLRAERERLDREIRELQQRRDRLDEVIEIATVPGACTTA